MGETIHEAGENSEWLNDNGSGGRSHRLQSFVDITGQFGNTGIETVSRHEHPECPGDISDQIFTSREITAIRTLTKKSIETTCISARWYQVVYGNHLLPLVQVKSSRHVERRPGFRSRKRDDGMRPIVETDLAIGALRLASVEKLASFPEKVETAKERISVDEVGGIGWESRSREQPGD